MSNPLTSLVALAEFRTASMIRNAVESVVGPIRVKSQEIVGEVVDTATRSLRTALIKAVLGLFAAAMLIVAVVYLLSALSIFLSARYGTETTTLIMAGAFALVGVIALLVVVFWPSASATASSKGAAATDRAGEATASVAQTLTAKAEAAAADARRVASETGSKAAGSNTNTAADASTHQGVDAKSGFEAIIGALGDAGFRREQAGLRAGLALASQLKPAQIVSLALVGGFVAGMRQRRRR